MRSSSIRVGIVVFSCVLAACGVFGASDDASEPPAEPEKEKADENAQPPVGDRAVDGIFVSSSMGFDTANGARDNPVKTLARGLALGKENKKRVIVCAEDYPEALTVLDGVSVYGNYDCHQPTWPAGPSRARLLSPTSPAVTARALSLATRVEGFEVIAPDLDGKPATDGSGTSIALDVRDSKGLVISGTLVRAGKGAPGTDGSEGATNALTPKADGIASGDQKTNVICFPPVDGDCTKVAITGAAGGVTTCAIGPSGGPGGKAGDGRWYHSGIPSSAATDFRGLPLAATASTNVGGKNELAANDGVGLPGANGVPGPDGKDGASGTYAITAAGFVRGNGTAGEAGAPGQGGGGGGGTGGFFTEGGGYANMQFPPDYYYTASGGSGAGGGCGGQAGTPGTGGGASIGALLVKSAVTFERSRVESSTGGRAGKGTLGTIGIRGGTGGAGALHTIRISGKGGDGGFGGNGGASGHGAPGPSIAIAFTEKPTLTDTELAPGPAGEGEPELTKIGAGTTGTKRLAAVTGESKAEHFIQ